MRAVVGAAALATLAGCGGSSSNALRPEGDEAATTAVVWWLLLGTAVAVGLVVTGFILWGSLRAPRPNPQGMTDDRFIAIGGIALPALVLIATGVLTVVATTMLRPATAASDALRIEIVGHQYWWEITYPDQGIVTANELTVPVGRPVELTLRSADVIHSFWVPQLAGKQDLIPGQTNHLPIEVRSAGTYVGVCAEFCGIQHAGMGITVHALTSDDFGTWLAEHDAIEQATSAQAQRGRAVFEQYPCGGCHRIADTEAQGDIAPDLTDLAIRSTLGAGVLDNNPENLAKWITGVSTVKPGALMQDFDIPDDDLDALVAYLESVR